MGGWVDDGWIDGWMDDEWMEVWMEVCMDGWTDGWTVGRKDGRGVSLAERSCYIAFMAVLVCSGTTPSRINISV